MKREFRYGKKIKQVREARAWTQEQLAAAAGIEARTVQRVEKDLTKGPETLQAIAGAFDVDLENLRTTYLIPESKLMQTTFVSDYERFIAAEENDRSSGVTQNRPYRVTAKPAMSESRDIDSDRSPYRLPRHEQCLERRKETTSHSTGEARMAATAHRASHWCP